MAETQGRLHGLLAEFESPGALIRAARAIRDAGYKKFDAYSPFPVHGIDQAMGIKRTVLPWLVFGAGASGLFLGLLLQWWTNAWEWPWLVSGKPFFSLPANIPITFETTVLASSTTTFLLVWALNGLPKVWHPWFRSDRFLKVTDNGFFLGIEADDPRFDPDGTAGLLQQAGAIGVEVVRLDPDPAKNRVPRPIITFIVVTSLMALIPIAVIASARTSMTTHTRLHVITDMDYQPRQKPETASKLFRDHRATRPPVKGTVAYGDLQEDDHFYRGVVRDAGGAPHWAETFPVADPATGRPGIALDDRTMARGKERFGIYCAPCHGAAGHGDGMIHRHATKVANRWTPPADLHAERIVRLPHGQLFFTIGNGVRNMPSYATQIPPADRWAIVLYLRALQRSQRAMMSDVPAAQQGAIR